MDKAWLAKAVERAGGRAKVAAEAGISIAHVKALCLRQRSLTPEAVARLCRVLDVPDAVWLDALKSRPFRKRSRPPRAEVTNDAS